MAQAGYTPLLIYGSGTTGNTPAAGNLTTSASGVELALNYFDGKLFYKDNAGVVQTLAVKMPSGVLPIANGGTNGTATPTAGAVAYGTGTAYAFTAVGTAGQPLLSNAGSAPAFGTLGVAGGGTGLTSLTANRIPYGAGTSAFANSANLTFDGSTLSVNSVNVGRGAGAVATNTAVGASALNANTTGANNVAVGYFAGAANTTAQRGVFVGYQAGANLTTGDFNTGIGWNAVGTNQTGTYNVGVGMSALQSATSGTNTAVGGVAGQNLSSGGPITAVGYRALNGTTTGTYNVAVGFRAADNNTTGGNLTALGDWALFSNTTASGNTAVGYQAAYSNTTGTSLTAIGYRAGYSTLSGFQNTFLGYEAGFSTDTAGTNTAIGYQALRAFTNSGGSAFTHNTAIGNEAAIAVTTGTFNTALGSRALNTATTASSTIAIGQAAGGAISTGNQNIAIGISSMGTGPVTGAYNIALGHDSGTSLTSGTENVFIGTRATSTVGGAGYLNTTGSYNVAVGNGALRANTTASNNTALGAYSLNANTTANDNTAIGTSALLNNTGGSNVAVGTSALRANTTASQGVAVGYRALYSNTTTSNNVAVGNDAAFSNTTGGVIAVGYQSLYNNSTGTNNTALGYQALRQNETGSSNIAIGYQALNNSGAATNAGSFVVGVAYTIKTIGTTDFTLIGAASNTVGVVFTATGVGTGTGTATPNANYSVAIGTTAGLNNLTGSITAVGHEAGLSNTTGDVTAFGYRAGRSNTTGTGNIAIGSSALIQVTTGSNNISIGTNSSTNTVTGSGNITIGHYAGYGNVGAASNNTVVGLQALYIGGTTATVNNCTAFGYGALYNAYGTTNTAVGYQSGNLITSGTKNSILGSYNGNQGGLDIRTASNYIVLSDGDGNPRQIIDGSGRVLINQTADVSGARLQVKHSSDTEFNAFTVNSSATDAYIGIGYNNANSQFRIAATYALTAGYKPLAIFAGGAEGLRVNTSQGVQTANCISVGAATPSTSGAGITFPATQSASTDANTLDDYEEGTWTPAIEGSTTAGVGTYTSRNGYYTKIGRQVTCSFWIDWSAHTGTGNLRISGFPFAVANLSNNYACGVFGETANITVSANNVLSSFTLSSTATVAIVLQRPIGGTTDTQVPIDASAYTMGTITYFSA